MGIGTKILIHRWKIIQYVVWRVTFTFYNLHHLFGVFQWFLGQKYELQKSTDWGFHLYPFYIIAFASNKAVLKKTLHIISETINVLIFLTWCTSMLLKDSLRECCELQSVNRLNWQKRKWLRPGDESWVFEIINEKAEADLVLSGRKYGLWILVSKIQTHVLLWPGTLEKELKPIYPLVFVNVVVLLNLPENTKFCGFCKMDSN